MSFAENRCDINNSDVTDIRLLASVYFPAVCFVTDRFAVVFFVLLGVVRYFLIPS